MRPPSLPLHCSICPKKPDFSDVSHLLTHVASKGHLSHYYKIKVRSSNDQTSRQIIDTYDQWYSDWNVEGLMMERLNLKDRKRSKGQGLSTSLQLFPKKQLRRKEQQVDPLLTGTLFRTQSFAHEPLPFQPEPELETQVSTLGSPMKPERSVFKPRLHLWSTTDPDCYDAVSLEISSPIPSSPLHFFRQFPRAAPLAQMFRRTELEVEIDEDDEEIYSEATKLKGVLWPGMNIFDAATPDMKRKRNQKKEISVVARLERNSYGVEASEMIFTPKGSLWKQRPISGHVDFDSSPYKVSRPSPPPKRKTSARAPLATRDSNKSTFTSQRISASRRVQRNDYLRHLEEKLGADTQPQHEPEVGRKSAKKRKKNFSVFNERTDQPALDTTGMKILTSEFHHGQLAAYEPAQRSSRSLDGPLAALYQPALHNNYFPDTFEGYHPALYGVPYYAYYGHATYGVPEGFTLPPQLPILQDVEQVIVPEDKTFSDTTHIASGAASDD